MLELLVFYEGRESSKELRKEEEDRKGERNIRKRREKGNGNIVCVFVADIILMVD